MDEVNLSVGVVGDGVGGGAMILNFAYVEDVDDGVFGRAAIEADEAATP